MRSTHFPIIVPCRATQALASRDTCGKNPYTASYLQFNMMPPDSANTLIGKWLKTVGGIVSSDKNVCRDGVPMKAKNGQRPINILSEYLTSWIRKNSEEALPFDSFENLRSGRVAQKNVERWIFNCNYLYNRVGDFLYECGLLPHTAHECATLIRSIDNAFKSISDNTPLDLRSKPTESIVYELARDWPPFSKSSRNTLSRFTRMLDAFRNQNPAYCAEHAVDLEELCSEIEDEAAFYAALETRLSTPTRSLATSCRTLLPLWCAKQLNPLFSLLIWSDEKAITELVDELADAFATQASASYGHDGAISAWREATLQAQASYIYNIDDDSLADLSIPEIGRLLTDEGFSLDHDDVPAAAPRWLLGKSRLIWNIVICSILGPEEAIGCAQAGRTPTRESFHALPSAHTPNHLTGEVLLRRRFRSGRIETVERLALDNVYAPGPWKIIGSHYDPHAPLPNSVFRTHFNAPGVSFIASEVHNGKGDLVEGAGDSRFHLEVSLQLDSRKRVSIVARDLDSKNGSCILRTTGRELICYAFPGRCNLTANDWARRLDIPEEHVLLADEVVLERGDTIKLADSCFELI